MKLLDHLNGWWRGTERDEQGVQRVVSFVNGGAADKACFRYRCDEWTSGDAGTKRHASETGYVKGDKMVLATTDMRAETLKCREHNWSESTKEGELRCATADESLVRHFQISKYAMQVTLTTNGNTATALTLKDNVNWKYIS